MSLFRRPIWLIIFLHIFYNWRDKKKYSSKYFKKAAGYRHSKLSTQESLDYINMVYNDYLMYGNLNTDNIIGKTVLEIGPGDNFGVALKFLASGAEKVICIDKFHYGNRDTEKEKQIYLALENQLDMKEKENFKNSISLTDGIIFNQNRFKYISGKGIEESYELFRENKFDIIVSRAVLEHLCKPEESLVVMDKILKPGGIMVHCIDFRDHGIFSNKGWHPHTFLTLEDSSYKRMIMDSGKPNRRMADFYFDFFINNNYEIKYFVSHILGNNNILNPAKEKIELGVDYFDSSIKLLEEIKPKLQPEFMKIPDEYLLYEAIFLYCQKPIN